MFRSKKARLATIAIAFATVIVVRALATDGGLTVTATADAAAPNPVAPGELATAALSASATSPNGMYGTVTFSDPTWGWTATGADGLDVVIPDNTSPAATLKATITTPGEYTITVTAKATWVGSDSSVVTQSGFTTVNLVVAGVESLQYFQPDEGEGSYVDVTGTLYVLVGKSVSFQATPTGEGEELPPDNPVWSGTAGATGTGATNTVTFSTLSASTDEEDYQTVTITCGNTSVTVYVIVYDLILSLTPQDNFTGRDPDFYGVCELIDLSSTIVPTGISLYDIGGLEWQIDDGIGVIDDNGDGTGTYECAAVADTVTLALAITNGPMLAQKKLAPPKGIVPPNAHAMQHAPSKKGLWHEKGKQGCVALLLYWAKGPKDVSFANIQCREGESDGINGTGLFAGLNGTVHTPTNDGQGNPLWHELLRIPDFEGFLWVAKDECGTKNPGAFKDGLYHDSIYMMYRKKLDPQAANADIGQWYASTLSLRWAKEENGVMQVWKDPVPVNEWFVREVGANPANDTDHQNYDD